MFYDRKDFIRAEKYFNYAANTRENFMFVNRINSVAREYMGRLCERQGKLAEAYHWYELAAEDYNNQKMKLKMADANFYGDGVPRDIQQALNYYSEAAQYKTHEYFFEAQNKLAWIYELGEFVDKDLTKADEYWEKLPPECKPARA